MIGERVGDWILEKVLGRGGMGTVYLARPHLPITPPRGGPVAIKIMAPELTREPGLAERFHREIALLRNLKHEHIVEFLADGEHNGVPYFVMEYVDGASLAEHLENHGPAPWPAVLEIGVQVCRGLQYAHQREIIHRDLKPSNLLRTATGIIKLADFGVAKVVGGTALTDTNAVVCTADYASPEAAMGRQATRRSDLYSLGVVFYHLLTGRLPFVAESAAAMLHQHRYGRFDPPGRWVSGLPHEFDALVVKLMEKNPENRPATAAEVEDALMRLRRKQERRRDSTLATGANQPTQAEGSPTTLDTGWVTPQRRYEDRLQARRWWLQFGGIVLTLALVGWLIYQRLRSPDATALIAQAEQRLAEEDWRSAEATLDRLRQRYPDAAATPQVAALREQAALGLLRQQARREAGPFAFSAPRSEAERLYRRGVLEFYSGRATQARQTWTYLIEAFDDVPANAPWIELAKNALKESPAATNLAAKTVEAALERAAREPPAAARRRLQAMLALYGEAGADATLAAAVAKLRTALAALEESKP